MIIRGQGFDQIGNSACFPFLGPSRLKIKIRLRLWTRIIDIYTMIGVDQQFNHQGSWN